MILVDSNIVIVPHSFLICVIRKLKSVRIDIYD